MKIFRRPFWKAETSKCYVIPMSVLFVLFLPYPIDFIYNSECYEFHPLVLLPIGMFALVFLFMPSQYFLRDTGRGSVDAEEWYLYFLEEGMFISGYRESKGRMGRRPFFTLYAGVYKTDKEAYVAVRD